MAHATVGGGEEACSQFVADSAAVEAVEIDGDVEPPSGEPGGEGAELRAPVAGGDAGKALPARGREGARPRPHAELPGEEGRGGW